MKTALTIRQIVLLLFSLPLLAQSAYRTSEGYLASHGACAYSVYDGDSLILLYDLPCKDHNISHMRSTGPYLTDADKVTIVRYKRRTGLFLGGKVVWMDVVRVVPTSRGGGQDRTELRNLKDKEVRYRTAPGDK